MATMRLGDVERGSIKSNFSTMLARANNNKSFPMEEDEIWDFGMSLLPVQTAEYYQYLRDHAKELTTEAGWNPEFGIRNDEAKFSVTIYGVTLPQEHLQLLDTHPRYAEILEWCEHRHVMSERIDDADYYMREVVDACSSVGQIKRLMPEDILRFVPSQMRDTFKHAERRSRVPRDFTPEPERAERLGQMLAIGSLSPENREGLQIYLNRTPL